MKVLMVAGKSELGGAPKSMLEMIKCIRDIYGVEYTVLVHKEGRISQFCKENGIGYCVDGHEPICIGRGSTGIRRFGKWMLRPIYALRCTVANKKALAVVSEKLDLSTFDLIHTNSNRDGIGALIAQKYGKKHLWHLREFGKEDYDTAFLPPYGIDFMNQTTTKFVAISDAVARAWSEKGLDGAKIQRIYNGIKMDGVMVDPDRSAFATDEVKMVFTGTICPSKGQLELIEALGLLDDKYKKKVKVDFYGEGPGDYIAMLQKKVDAYGMSEHVRFCGFSDKVGQILCRYNVGVVCSRAEAFGRITPEYMAAGLIVIGSDTGANPELIEEGKSGFMYPLNNYARLAEIIGKICDMGRERRLEISRHAENYARSNFTAEKNAANIYAAYCGL